MIRVKICGVREAAHALAAIEAGADMLGFIFYAAARRYVEPRLVRDLLAGLPRGSFEAVGVFVNESPDRIDEIAEMVGLDLIQLSGDEAPELNTQLSRPIVRTVHVDDTTMADQISTRVAGAKLIHLDAKKAGQYGGTGATFDWRIARVARGLGAVLLAGGLNPANVGEAIRVAQPWGVDVSSGVERDGVKDPQLIRTFVKAARSLHDGTSPAAIRVPSGPDGTSLASGLRGVES
jgi:phosphoribosylanthranilate isomerase